MFMRTDLSLLPFVPFSPAPRLSAMSDTSSSPALSVIILAAGYGTRLDRDLRSSPSFSYLRGTPKPLLPIGGRLLLDHWFDALVAFQSSSSIPLSSVTIVTNTAHIALYKTWSSTSPIPTTILANASTNPETRQGAVADIHLGLTASPAPLILVLAGDTLLPNTALASPVEAFASADTDLAVFAYALPDARDCARRGMISLTPSGRAASLVEKPPTPAASPSNLASAPVYLLRAGAGRASVNGFLCAARADGRGLDARDAPGLWLAHALASGRTCDVVRVETRVDIGGLAHYKDALAECAGGVRGEREAAVGRALPRVGLVGNPSDGYGGACLACTVVSEGYAEVVATKSEGFEVAPNTAMEMPAVFEDLAAFGEAVGKRGLDFGARKLVLAAAAVFEMALRKLGKNGNGKKCCLRYETTIPVCVGLSGSSAIVLATMRALARFYSVTLKEIDADIATWPGRLLAAEKDMLGIEAGLMDRVAQVYGGVTFMDFSKGGLPVVTSFKADVLPDLFLLTRGKTAGSEDMPAGESSGVVHRHLRARFDAGETAVVQGMENLAELGNMGHDMLQFATKASLQLDGSDLPYIFERNWKLRQSMVCAKESDVNVELVRVANSVGLVAKQTGSGGAVVCVPKPQTASIFADDQVSAVQLNLSEQGYHLRKLKVGKRYNW